MVLRPLTDKDLDRHLKNIDADDDAEIEQDEHIDIGILESVRTIMTEAAGNQVKDVGMDMKDRKPISQRDLATDDTKELDGIRELIETE